MAEIVGVIASGITLAALFKSCIEAFDLIQTGHNQELDLVKLVLRLNIEKCRLFTWGESMGLTSTPDEAEPTASASCEFREVMMQTLETIFHLFNDSKKLQDRYGCKQYLDSPATNDTEQTSHVRFLAASFDNFQMTTLWRGKRSKLLMKARWAIHDRKRFASFVSEIKELVDGLQHITKPLVPLSRQEDAMKRGIERINDAETLDMVSEVCQNDHSELSKVALARAETISSASTNRWKIERWDCRTEGIELEEMVDLESLNITELKHQMLRMMRERKELEIQLQHLRGSVLSLPVPPTPFPILPKIGEGKLPSPPEHQQKGLDSAEEATAGVPVQMQVLALRSLEQNSGDDGDDHVADQSGRLTQLEQSGPSCSANVETGSEPYHGIRSIEKLPVDINWSRLVALSPTAPADDPVYEQQDEGKHRAEPKLFACTNHCGQTFRRKGDWARHERTNFEEWTCYVCAETLTRKEHLRTHLKYSHDKREIDLEKYKHQLLAPTDRPCGFCGKRFLSWQEWLAHVGAHFEGSIRGRRCKISKWKERKMTAPGPASGHHYNGRDGDAGNGDAGDNNDDGNGCQQWWRQCSQQQLPGTSNASGVSQGQVADHSEGLNATVTDAILHLQGASPQGDALVSKLPVQLTAVNPRLDAPSTSGLTLPEGFSGGVNVNTPGDKSAAPVQKSKTPTKKERPSETVRKDQGTMPAKSEGGEERKALFNGFLDYDVLTGSSARNKNQQEDYFVLSFNVPRRTALFASLGHCHYAAASYVARLASSRNAPTLPSQWPRNLQITTFVDGSFMDQLLHKSFGQPLLHIYVFGIFEFVTTCSVEGGCLQVLFDVLAESREYAECIPEITSIDYPTPRVYIVPIGASAVVPRFLRHIQPTLEPTSKILLLLLVYEEEDFATLNDKTVTRKVFQNHKSNSLPAKLSKIIMSTIPE